MATSSMVQDLELVEESRQSTAYPTSTTMATIIQEGSSSPTAGIDDDRQHNNVQVLPQAQPQAFNYNAPIRVTQGSPGLIAMIVSIIFLATGNFVRCSDEEDTPTEGIFKQYDGLDGKTGPTRELAQAGAISAVCFGFLGLAASYIRAQKKTSTIESASYLVAFIMQLLSFTFIINHPFCDGKNDCSNNDWDYIPQSSLLVEQGQSCTISWWLPFTASILFALSALAAAW